MTMPQAASWLRSRRFWRTTAWTLLLFTLAGGFFWYGDRRLPTEAASGEGWGEPPATVVRVPEPTRLKLGSFNIRGSQAWMDSEHLSKVAARIKAMDLVGFNEAHGGDPDQVRAIAELNAWMGLFAPTERRWFRDSFGNGVVAHPRLLTGEWQRVPLPGTQWSGHRNTLTVRVNAGASRTRILITHIDRTVDREMQLRLVIERFLKLKAPAVLMGDLNTRRNDRQLAALLARADTTDAVGEALKQRGETDIDRIDWIITRGLRIVDGGLTPADISDHPFIWVEVEYPHATTQPAATQP